MKPLPWISACALSLLLLACGGDDDGDRPAPPPPGPPLAGDRIEPLDTALLKQARRPAAVQALSRLPAGAQVARIALGPLPELKQAAAPASGGPLQIGVGRDIAATADAAALGRLLDWTRLPDGTQVAALSFAAEGARALRLGVQVGHVPPGAMLRFYSDPDSDVVEMTAEEIRAGYRSQRAAGVPEAEAGRVWGPDTPGAVSTLELHLPAGTDPGRLQLAVPQLSQLSQTVAEAVQRKDVSDIGASGSCHVDVACTRHDSESRAVAKMLYTKGGGTFLCSGTLVNDSAGSLTPYFLTAAHCIDDGASASSLITYWFFRAAACDASGRLDRDMVRLTGGASLLEVHYPSDMALLRLRSDPPPRVVYAGSYFGPDAVPGVSVLGVHHPSGDVQKVSEGGIRAYASCIVINNETRCSVSPQEGDMLQVIWNRGSTEGGSSGSALFASAGGTQYVVGTLFAGNASCRNPDGSDFYGRYEPAFAASLQRWLWP